MSVVDTLREALFGNPPSDGFKPSREGVIKAIVELSAQIALSAGGFISYNTLPELNAYVPDADGPHVGFVLTTADAGIYKYVESWQPFTEFYTAVLTVVQPLVDDVNAALAQVIDLLAAQSTSYGQQLVNILDVQNADIWQVQVDAGSTPVSGSIGTTSFMGAKLYDYDLGSGAGQRRVHGFINPSVDFDVNSLKAGDVITLAFVTHNLNPAFPEVSKYSYFSWIMGNAGGFTIDDYIDASDGYRVHFKTVTLQPSDIVHGQNTGQLNSILIRTNGEDAAYSGSIGAPMVFKGDTKAFVRYLADQFEYSQHSAYRVVGVGHSYLQGAGAEKPGDDFLSLIGKNLNRPTVNLGVGGQTSDEISSRFGARPVTFTLEGNQLPASGAATITNYDTDIGYFAGNSAYFSYDGVAIPSVGNAVAGRFKGLGGSNQHGGGAYQFVRAVAGDAVFFPSNAKFYSSLHTQYQNDIVIMMLDRNNIDELFTGSRDYKASVDNAVSIIKSLAPRDSSTFVLEDWNIAYEGNDGPSHYPVFVKLGDFMQRVLGDRYIRTRRLAIDFGLSIAGISPTAGDLEDVARDEVPRSLREPSSNGDPRGGLHPNSAGHYVIAQIATWAMNARGF